MQLTRYLLAASLIAGCTTDQTKDDGLDIQVSDSRVSGTYNGKDGTVTFTATETAPQEFDIVLDLNGLAITAILDRNKGVFEYDGYAAADGSDTTMTDPDRALIGELAHALDPYGNDAPAPLTLMRNIASTWSEFPSTKSLQVVAFADPDRSYTSDCVDVNHYVWTSHDCSGRNYQDDSTTLDYSYISMHGACAAADGTYFWNGAWTCYEPDHDTNIEYAYGNCFGRCGAGCGTGTQFTYDCEDHDNCVRTGHDLASLWCDDEFTATIDDAAAAPNCL